MSKLNILLLLFILVSCSNKENSDIEANVTSTGYKKTFVWGDEFNYEGAPDATNWAYELGYVRNNEVQCYTSRLKNARVEYGRLVIESHKEDYAYNGKNYAYTSASVITKGKKYFEGDIRVEVFARIPDGKGIWPAIWMMGKSYTWPQCSEIDIMEYVGSIPNVIHGTMHWADSLNVAQKKGDVMNNNYLHTQFHLYAMERVGNNIKLFFDDTCFFDFTAPADTYKSSFIQPLYLLLNTAMGGSWAGDVDNSILPVKMEVDYVRVYSLSKNN